MTCSPADCPFWGLRSGAGAPTGCGAEPREANLVDVFAENASFELQNYRVTPCPEASRGIGGCAPEPGGLDGASGVAYAFVYIVESVKGFLPTPLESDRACGARSPRVSSMLGADITESLDEVYQPLSP